MDSKPPPPPKPWERPGSSSGAAPFKPSSPGTTSDVVEASGTANPGEIVTPAERTNSSILARPVPTRPWEQQNPANHYGGYGSTLAYNNTYGGYRGGSLGGGLYGNSMYRTGYGYGGGGLYGSSGMYGAGGMYNNGGLGGGYGMGMGGGPYGDQDPNNPFNAPPSPPGFWVSFLRVMNGVVTFFGRVAFLVDQNTQAFHFFISALLQLFERSGMLYGELARFVLRLLGVRTKPRKVTSSGADRLSGQNYVEGPKVGQSGAWDNVWGG